MREQARTAVQTARAIETRNNEKKTDTTARRAGMVFADWQAGRQIKKPGQTRGHRQERQEGRLAEGQAAQRSRRPCVTGTDAAGQLPGRVRGVAGRRQGGVSILFLLADRGGGVPYHPRE